MQIVLVRHAQPENCEAQQGRPDPKLDELGVVQAAAVREALTQESIAAIYSSPARRARETAAPLAESLDLDVEIRSQFAEFNTLSSDYLSVEEMRRRGDPRWDTLLRGELYDCRHSADELRARITDEIDRIVADHPSQTVVVFTHAGAVNLYTGGLLGVSRPIWTAPALAGITRIRADRTGRRMVVSLNETGHLTYLRLLRDAIGDGTTSGPWALRPVSRSGVAVPSRAVGEFSGTGGRTPRCWSSVDSET